MLKKIIINQQGYIALTTVLILLAVITSISLVVAFSSIGEAQSALALFKGEDGLTFTEGCVEDVMLKARSNPSLTSGTFTRLEGTCSFTINSKTGTNPITWDVDVTSSFSQYKRTIKVIFNRGVTGVTLTSWNEI